MKPYYTKVYKKKDCEKFVKLCRDISQEQKAINGGKAILTLIYKELSELSKTDADQIVRRTQILIELPMWEKDQRVMKYVNRLRQRGLSILAGQHSPKVGEKFIYE